MSTPNYKVCYATVTIHNIFCTEYYTLPSAGFVHIYSTSCSCGIHNISLGQGHTSHLVWQKELNKPFIKVMTKCRRLTERQAE